MQLLGLDHFSTANNFEQVGFLFFGNRFSTVNQLTRFLGPSTRSHPEQSASANAAGAAVAEAAGEVLKDFRFEERLDFARARWGRGAGGRCGLGLGVLGFPWARFSGGWVWKAGWGGCLFFG